MAKSQKLRPAKQKAVPVEKLAAFHVCGLEDLTGNLQPVLVMQGGGALGAYQAGVYQAMHEAECEPEWVIGTSIGAINAGLIAGNPPERRVEALSEFWNRMSRDNRLLFPPFNLFPAATTMMLGLPGFFAPKTMIGTNGGGPEQAAIYSTSPLAKTLGELIDINLLNSNAPRLTVGAVNVAESSMKYFDSRDMPQGKALSIAHLMASGALPPAFPSIEIDGAFFWDGGILSNTPIEAIFDDAQRKSSLVFSVEVWHGQGPVPTNINDALTRHKDIQYASRDEDHIRRQRELHKLRHVITQLVGHLPEAASQMDDVIELAGYGCTTRMHVVRLSAPVLQGEDHTKDIDFSPQGVTRRWQAGREDTLRMFDEKPWKLAITDPLESVIVHNALAQSDEGQSLNQGG